MVPVIDAAEERVIREFEVDSATVPPRPGEVDDRQPPLLSYEEAQHEVTLGLLSGIMVTPWR